MPPGVIPMDFTVPHRERGERMLKLTRAGVIGQPKPQGEVDASPEVQELYFDLVRRSVASDGANGAPFTVQWKFADVEPWHVVVDNGSTRAERGISGSADVTLETSWHDFVEIGKGAVSPPKALIQRRLKVHGGPRNLLRFRKLFG
jgi:putative sterol carrier protein